MNAAAHLHIAVARVARQPLNSPVRQDARRPLRLARRRLVETREPAPDLFAEKVQHGPDDGRQAGADDADAALEPAPERELVVVVGRVRVRAEQ